MTESDTVIHFVGVISLIYTSTSLQKHSTQYKYNELVTRVTDGRRVGN